MNLREVLTTKDAAEILSVSVVTVRRMVHAGLVHVYAKGVGSRAWLFDRSELEAIRAERVCFRSFKRNELIKRRVIQKDILSAVMSPAVRLFQKEHGKGMTEVWDLILGYSHPKTGKIECYFDTLAYQADVPLSYIKACVDRFAQWQWIKSEYRFGTSKLIGELYNPDGSIPEDGIPEYSEQEMAADGDGWQDDSDDLDDVETIPEPDYLPEPGTSFDLLEKEPEKSNKSNAGKLQISKYRPTDDDVQAVFEFWKMIMGKDARTKLDAGRTKKIRWALNTYESIERCKLAIIGMASNPWNMGKDPKNMGKKFDDISLCFRDAEHFESFEMQGGRATTYIDSKTGMMRVKVNGGHKTYEERIEELAEKMEREDNARAIYNRRERLDVYDVAPVYEFPDSRE